MADFAAAQQRILARRAAREQALTTADAQHHAARATSLLQLPAALRTLAFDALGVWDGLRSPYGTQPAFRVGQVDAELLDEAMLALLKNQAGEGLKLYGAHWKDDWDAEVTAALRAALWKLSVWDHGASYGASLQGLRFVDARGKGRAGFSPQHQHQHQQQLQDATKTQRLLYGLVTVGGRYAWSKWEARLAARDNGYGNDDGDGSTQLLRRLARLTTLASTAHNLAAFLSFLVFLHNGHYRTLLDRVLRLRLVPASNQTSREVSFEFLNRQLVWHAFTEFLLFLLPLVGISRWRRWVSRAWKRTAQTIARFRSGTAASPTEGVESEKKTGELGFLPERTCAICYQDQNPAGGQSEQELLAGNTVGGGGAAGGGGGGVVGSAMTDITNPYETIPCGCIYCFVCLAQRIEAEEGEGWVCLRCGELVKECQPWNGDVELSRPLQRPQAQSQPRLEGMLGNLNRRKSVTFDLKDEEKSTEGYDESSESDGAGLLGSRSGNVDWSMVDDDPFEEEY